MCGSTAKLRLRKANELLHFLFMLEYCCSQILGRISKRNRGAMDEICVGDRVLLIGDPNSLAFASQSWRVSRSLCNISESRGVLIVLYKRESSANFGAF